ncbi:RICIN domain-containing protein [Actinoplanes sp. NPDC026619]|uniref:RICIN domain-containing protein n=1 Tax=Actinoplanes sp. NPDC026619 TaxID=3155798 RepID=UPI0033D4AE7E
MRKLLVLVLLAAAALVGTSTSASAAPATGAAYQLKVTKSGMCIDVPSASTANSALLQQWGCTDGAKWQQFTLTASGSNYLLVNVNSGKCIDVPNYSTTSGTQLQQYTCVSSQTNQQWQLVASGTGTYQIVNVGSGLCISDAGASTTSGAAIIQETCSANTNKQWAFVAIGGRTWSSTADGFAAGTTGGAGGTTVTVTTYADLLKYATASAAYVIKVSGTITVPTYGYEIPVTSNKTMIGVGTTGRIKAGGFFLGAGVKNVIIRNLTIGDTAVASDDPDDKDFDYDGIQMDTADHVWIDHNTFQNINDGYIDSRKDTNYVTVSWNQMGNHNKTFGIGWTDNVIARMTIHHNWIYNSNQRNPSADNLLYAHLYNNYLQNVTSYGNYSRGATKMVIENSYFDTVKDPFYPDSTAQLKQSGSIMVNCTGNQTTLGSAFTPSSFYSYTLDAASAVPSLVKTYSGPQANIS